MASLVQQTIWSALITLITAVALVCSTEGKITCDVTLRMDKPVKIGITCILQSNVTSSSMNQPEPSNKLAKSLLSCWHILESNPGIVEENNIEECLGTRRQSEYNCFITNQAEFDNKDTINYLGMLDGNCENKLHEFYNTINDYHKPCNTTTGKEKIANLLEKINITLIDWGKIENLAAVCLLPEEICTENKGFKNRIAQLTEADYECTFFRHLNAHVTCCHWNLGCKRLLHNTVNDAHLPEDCQKIPEENCRTFERNFTPVEGVICNATQFEMCHSKGYDLTQYIEHRNCSCESVSGTLLASIRKCSGSLKPTKEDLQHVANRTDVILADNAQLTEYINTYTGPVEDFFEFDVFVDVLPRERIENFTISDIDKKSEALFLDLPEPKKLALTRQTLEPLGYNRTKMEIYRNFHSKGCGFAQSISVKTLNKTGHISLQLALDMCACSEDSPVTTPAKVEVCCQLIQSKVNTYNKFLNKAENMCPLCLGYILEKRPQWRKELLLNKDMMDKACDKIGNSFVFPPSMLERWAQDCRRKSKIRQCRDTHPSMMAYRSTPLSPSELAICKDLFCQRLCSLSYKEITTIWHVLEHLQHEDVGCLAYLVDVTPQQNKTLPIVNGSSIDGSCPLKSMVIKRAQKAKEEQEQAKEMRSCEITCSGISKDIRQSIYPPDVLDVTQLENCLVGDVHKCIRHQALGEHHWDINQAKALLAQLRKNKSFALTETLTGRELRMLGFIGLGFTPNELATMEGLSNSVFDVFGVTYGWSPQQLQVLASRYLRDNNLRPDQLTNFDLARLNHIICGLPAEHIYQIPLKAIVPTTPILGKMQRCHIEVLIALANRLILYYGPVKVWPEDHFSEFGIMLAGLKGEDLKAVGTALSDHVTVPVVNYIQPKEFRKLSPEQTSLFRYEVSLALSRRGLCAWLSIQHKKQGYLLHLCSASTVPVPEFMVVFIIILGITLLIQ